MPRTVNGRKLVRDEPTVAPIVAKSGEPIYWTQIRTLTLDNGHVLYSCAHCDYIAASPNSVRPHLNRHRNGKKPAPTNGDDSVAKLIAKLGQVDRITRDRDRWKHRAQKAERDLKAIRQALGGGND